ncbi:MAG: phosphonate ABC transporter ATP-binding protein [Planctomycetota bacterium]
MTSTGFRLSGASVAYNGTGSRAVDGVDLEIRPGEAVGIVGPSGSGKTTLLRLLNASLRPTAGEVAVGETPLSELPPRALRRTRARIGFVHQNLSLVPNLRVVHNVLMGRIGRRGLLGSLRSVFFAPRSAVSEVYDLLERVGIPEKLFDRVDTLSGGQQQRVAIARALYQQPEALLADEPVSSVDPARAKDTVALLARISREEGLTLCVSLHNLQLAREYLPRLVGMRRGRVAFDRPTGELADADFTGLYELGDNEMLSS